MSNDELFKEFDVLVNSALLRHNLLQTTSNNPVYDASRRIINKCSDENVNPYGAISQQVPTCNTISSSSTSSSTSSSSSGICGSGGSSFSNYKLSKLNEKLKFNHEFMETFKVSSIKLNKNDLIENLKNQEKESCKLKCKSSQLKNKQVKEENNNTKIKTKTILKTSANKTNTTTTKTPNLHSTAITNKIQKKNSQSDIDLKQKAKTNENNNQIKNKTEAINKPETKPLISKPIIRKSNSEFANLSNKRDNNNSENNDKSVKKASVISMRKNSINTDTVTSNSSSAKFDPIKPLSENTNTKIKILLTKSSPTPKRAQEQNQTSIQRNEDDTDLDVSDISPFGSNKNEESKDFDNNSVFSYLSTTSSTDSLKQNKTKVQNHLTTSLNPEFSIRNIKNCRRKINFKSSGSCITTSESEQEMTEASTSSSKKSKNGSLDALPTLLIQLLVLLLSQNGNESSKIGNCLNINHKTNRRYSAMSMSSKNKINLKNQLKTTPIASLLSLNKKSKFDNLVNSLTRSLKKVVDNNSKNNYKNQSHQKLLESIFLDNNSEKTGVHLNLSTNPDLGENSFDDKIKMTSSLVVDYNSNKNAIDTFSNISSPNPNFECASSNSKNRKARINSSDLEEINFYYDYFTKNKDKNLNANNNSNNTDEYDTHSLNLNSTSTRIEQILPNSNEGSTTQADVDHQSKSNLKKCNFKRSKSGNKHFLEIPNIDDPILFIDTLYNQLLANKSSRDDDCMSTYSTKSTTSCTNTNASDYSAYFKRFKLSDYSSNSTYLKNYCLINNISYISNDNSLNINNSNNNNNTKEYQSDISRNESLNSLSFRFDNSIDFNDNMIQNCNNNDEEMYHADNTFNNYFNNNDFSFIDLYSNKTNISNTSTTAKDCMLSMNNNLIDWNYDEEDSKMMDKLEPNDNLLACRDELFSYSITKCSCKDCARINNTKNSTESSSSSSNSSYIENQRFSNNEESVLFKNSFNETQEDINTSLKSSSSSNQIDIGYLHNFVRKSNEKLYMNTSQSDQLTSFDSSLLAASLSSNRSILPFRNANNCNINCKTKNFMRFSSLADLFSSANLATTVFNNQNQQINNNKLLMNCKYINNSNGATLRIFKSNSTSNVNSLNSKNNDYTSLFICTKANNMKSSATSPIIIKKTSSSANSTSYVQIIFNSFLKSLKFLIMTKNVFVLPIIIILLNTKFRNSSVMMSSASSSNIPSSAITIAATTAAAAAQLTEFYKR